MVPKGTRVTVGYPISYLMGTQVLGSMLPSYGSPIHSMQIDDAISIITVFMSIIILTFIINIITLLSQYSSFDKVRIKTR